jgi:hypothetical protein
MPQKGFIIGAESFIWCERGLLRAAELLIDDVILGLDRRGRLSWDSLSSLRRKRAHLMRIFSDSTEIVVGSSCGLFTARGMKRASKLTEEDLIETATLTSKISEKLDCKPFQYINTSEGPVAITDDLAYLLGTQVSAKRTDTYTIIDTKKIENLRTISGLFTETLDRYFISQKIRYIPRSTRIRLESKAFSEILFDVSTNYIPPFIRQSPSYVIRQFLCGVLDTIVRTNRYENPPTYFATLVTESHFRRFVFNLLRLFNVIPTKTYFFHPKDGYNYIYSFLRVCDLKALGLRFHWMEEPQIPFAYQPQPTGYSQVRNMISFRGDAYFLVPCKPHWSVVADLVPLHPEGLS